MPAADSPPHVAAYLAWRDASSADQREHLVRSHADYRSLLPSLDALRDNPGAVIGPSGKPLAECTGAERAEFIERYRALRDAAVARAKALDTAVGLAGLRI